MSSKDKPFLIFWEDGVWKARWAGRSRFSCIGSSPIQAYNNLMYWSTSEVPQNENPKLDRSEIYGPPKYP